MYVNSPCSQLLNQKQGSPKFETCLKKGLSWTSQEGLLIPAGIWAFLLDTFSANLASTTWT